MKLSRTFRSQSGSVLMTTLIMALLVGLVVSALLFVTRQHSTMVARARVWNSEIPIAEAGIEEALAHLNSNPRSLATNGWAAAGTNFVKKRVFTNAYGSDGGKKEMNSFAEASGGKGFVASTDDIVQVYRSISSFF